MACDVKVKIPAVLFPSVDMFGQVTTVLPLSASQSPQTVVEKLLYITLV